MSTEAVQKNENIHFKLNKCYLTSYGVQQDKMKVGECISCSIQGTFLNFLHCGPVVTPVNLRGPGRGQPWLTLRCYHTTHIETCEDN